MKTPSRTRIAAALGAGIVTFLLLDFAWLKLMADRLYRPQIGHLMRPDFDPWAAAAFYLAYFTGVAVFCVAPAKAARDALIKGALFGFVAYATYDLTNQATLKEWSWLVTVADLCWGTFVTAAGAGMARVALR